MRSLLGWLLALAFVLSACGDAGEPTANGEIKATVTRVVDGDTFEISTGEKVRMIGIDTPETVKPNHPVETYGKEASNFTKQLLTGQEVRLVFDVEPHDRYKRLLAYVYLPDGTFVNEKLVREGYARIMTIPPNVAYADLFLEAERDARKHNRGLWGAEPSADAGEPERGEEPSAATPSDSSREDAPPPGKPIKGNINAKGEKIYHMPGTSHYERTKAELWFATEEEAQAAGFRPPKR